MNYEFETSLKMIYESIFYNILEIGFYGLVFKKKNS